MYIKIREIIPSETVIWPEKMTCDGEITGEDDRWRVMVAGVDAGERAR